MCTLWLCVCPCRAGFWTPYLCLVSCVLCTGHCKTHTHCGNLMYTVLLCGCVCAPLQGRLLGPVCLTSSQEGQGVRQQRVGAVGGPR
jgi:hypothetical protein